MKVRWSGIYSTDSSVISFVMEQLPTVVWLKSLRIPTKCINVPVIYTLVFAVYCSVIYNIWHSKGDKVKKGMVYEQRRSSGKRWCCGGELGRQVLIQRVTRQYAICLLFSFPGERSQTGCYLYVWSTTSSPLFWSARLPLRTVWPHDLVHLVGGMTKSRGYLRENQ